MAPAQDVHTYLVDSLPEEPSKELKVREVVGVDMACGRGVQAALAVGLQGRETLCPHPLLSPSE